MGFGAGLLVGHYLCFPEHATVQTQHGRKCMRDVQIGESVQVITEDGTISMCDVYGWAHRDLATEATYLEVATENGGKITLSADHLLGVVRPRRHHHTGEEVQYVPAGEVREGERVMQAFSIGGTPQLRTVPVKSVRSVQAKGLFAPLTLEGTVIVDDVAASCYAAVPSHRAAHAALAPARAQYRHKGPERMAKHHNGKRFNGSLNYVDRLGRAAVHLS